MREGISEDMRWHIRRYERRHIRRYYERRYIRRYYEISRGVVLKNEVGERLEIEVASVAKSAIL